MAEVKNCLGIRGRIGDYVLFRLGGKTFLKRRVKENKSNTEKQQVMRARFRAAVCFYQRLKEMPLKQVLSVAARGRCVSGYALFMKMNLKAFGADGRIADFALLQFTVGKRQRAYSLEGWIAPAGRVTLEWRNGWISELREGQDRLEVVVLKEECSFSPELVSEGVTRNDRGACFWVAHKPGRKVHVYCYFVSPDGKELSQSQYVCLKERI